MAEGALTNNQRGRRSGYCRLWGGLDKARHIVTTALLGRVQRCRKGLYKAIDGQITRPIVLLMLNWSYCRPWRRLTIFKIYFGTCICSNVETILSWTCHVYGPFEFRTSLGTSILLRTRRDEIRCLWPSLFCEPDHSRRQDEIFLLTHVLGTNYHQISTEVRSMV